MTVFDNLFPTLNATYATGYIRSEAKDFQVNEINDTHFTETGEH
jgi:tRNA(Glu) U13 pseudouridine synthase TruD